MGLVDISKAAVESAIEEYDRLGRNEFLRKYGFQHARSYILVHDGREYDSKAILGAAHGFLDGRSPLTWKDFSGGASTVAKRLSTLGFSVKKGLGKGPGAPSGLIPFRVGQLYNRRSEIHAVFSGQQQGGIVTPGSAPFIFLFTGESGEQHGYSDGWRADGVFSYTGEGQRGDMQFVRGNRAIRDHAIDGKDLLLFEASVTRSMYRYRGGFDCVGWELGTGPDTDGNLRSTIVFLLALAAAAEAEEPPLGGIAPQASTLAQLRALAEEASSAAPSAGKDSRRVYYQRSAVVRSYVLARSAGNCEGCGTAAPFSRPAGDPYLEPHHVTRISDGGPDHPRHIIALCPNCHRRVHFSSDGPAFNKRLKEILKQLEP